MIARVIAVSAENRLLVLLATALAVAAALAVIPRLPLDALPDLSDTQVIVYSRWDRSPDVVEDQVTFPIVSALLGTPRVEAVRGLSDSATPTSTSSSRTGPTSTGGARESSST